MMLFSDCSLTEAQRRLDQLKKILAEGTVLYESPIVERWKTRDRTDESSADDWDLVQRKLVRYEGQVHLVCLVRRAKVERVGHPAWRPIVYRPMNGYEDPELVPAWTTTSTEQMTKDELALVASLDQSMRSKI